MQLFYENIFSFLVLLFGIPLIILGFFYKFHPPKSMSWNYGIQLKSAKRNKNTWQETHKFVPFPMMIIGFILTSIGLLPIFIRTDYFFTFESAIGINIVAAFILYLLVELHLNYNSRKSK